MECEFFFASIGDVFRFKYGMDDRIWRKVSFDDASPLDGRGGLLRVSLDEKVMYALPAPPEAE